MGTIESGAVFSKCLKYRFRLWRIWDRTKKSLLFLLLNPSKAGIKINDPTVTRCMQRARLLGFGGIEVCNLFAYRATNPRDMKQAPNPVGMNNNLHILYAARKCGMVIAGWGTHGSFLRRDREVRMYLRKCGVEMFQLGLTKDGQPRHPLYVGYKVTPLALPHLNNLGL